MIASASFPSSFSYMSLSFFYPAPLQATMLLHVVSPCVDVSATTSLATTVTFAFLASSAKLCLHQTGFDHLRLGNCLAFLISLFYSALSPDLRISAR